MGFWSFIWDAFLDDTLIGQIAKNATASLRTPSEKDRNKIEERMNYYSYKDVEQLIKILGDGRVDSIDMFAIFQVLKESYGLDKSDINKQVAEYRREKAGY